MEKEKAIDDLRIRFDELSKQIERIRDDWLAAHARSDIDRETELVRRESDLLNEVENVVKGLAESLRQARAA